MTQKSKLVELENFFVEEIKKEIPLVVVSDNFLLYKNIKIKRSKNGIWNLYTKTGDKIASFKIKTTASLAAKFYDKTDFKNFSLTKVLDQGYWNNYNDSEIFKYKLKTTKDYIKRDLFVARYELAKSRADHYKKEITSLFKVNF